MDNNKLVTFETESDFRINSYEFLNNIINPTRIDSGEKKVQHAKFIARIKDELDDDVVVQKSHDLQNKGIQVVILNYDQAILVGMRESKAIRKTVLLTLKKLIVGGSNVPKSFGDALLLAGRLEKEKEQLALDNKEKEKKIIKDAPKVNDYEKLISSDGLSTATTVANALQVKSGNNLNEFLVFCKVVYDSRSLPNKVFRSFWIDNGLGKIVYTADGYPSCKFYKKGQSFISRLIDKNKSMFDVSDDGTLTFNPKK